MPSKQVVAHFEINTTYVVLDMAFSRDGKYLLMVGGIPDFNISIYDIENGNLLPITEANLPCTKDELLEVSFNPKNKLQFCILSNHTLYFYSLLPAFMPVSTNGSGENDV